MTDTNDIERVELPPLPARDPRGHKGTFGTVCVVGGCAGKDVRMIGAPALSAEGALRAGCGLVRLCMPEPILDEALAITPSATGLPIQTDAGGEIEPHVATTAIDRCIELCDCLVIGPGMGPGPGTASATLRAVQQEERHVVVDADGLNALAATPELFRDFHASAVLTPHPGEYRRLAEALNMPSADPTSEESRPHAAEMLAQRLGCVVVLKGAGTIVTDGHRTWRCDRSNAALATAGTGDVLSGVIAGLAAQFTPPPRVGAMMTLAGATGNTPRPPGKPLGLFESACLGVEAHALAAELWTESSRAGAGLTAQELARKIPEALDRLRRA
jgi:NAD(P)H-hydrate epimerase